MYYVYGAGGVMYYAYGAAAGMYMVVCLVFIMYMVLLHDGGAAVMYNVYGAAAAPSIEYVHISRKTVIISWIFWNEFILVRNRYLINNLSLSLAANE